ncbi:1-acyl-sn-glycerol-3-phosphate acyltransferase [Natronospira proteinivora]|uniref:1-acyl-sn-glycerol-3-phosphate acyltransferase n=1 Tax=Natronospira proteinivora TaxID=1807133 RepID=A0ABT1G659_9GAMM|nr:AMP-binding protein [Natronospira proteinivora]MCP1726784.1 1-acyl-sn-glycerol-3-phosphate acyltransferase [Natronospira proteinivora]
MSKRHSVSESELLDLIRTISAELNPRQSPPELSLDSALEREAGLDSLGRVELMLRIERRFGLRIPDEKAVSARTPKELLALLSDGNMAEANDPGQRDPALGQAQGEEPVEPRSAATLSQVLEWHADRVGDRQCLSLYQSGGEMSHLSYAELRDGAAELAAGLRDKGVGPGDRVALMLPTSLEFFFAFHGVMWAGGVPVPLYPPVRVSQVEDHFRRIAGVVENAECRCFIASRETAQAGQLLKSLAPSLSHVLTVDKLRQGVGIARVPRRSDDLAFLQYTSGTTGDPKGVMLSHANLLANIRSIGSVVDASHEDRFVSWLPLYHDMGLIGACLGTLYYGIPLFLMSPLQFMARPQSWLWAIHRHRATLSAAPNFAYDLCANRLESEELEGLDLSSWRVAFNGAEPISPQTLDGFEQRFAHYGFHRETMKPVYGLAESSVGLTFPPTDRAPKLDRIERDRFDQHGEARPAADTDETPRLFVACGKPLPEHEIRVVDEQGQPLPDRQQGHLQFRGPSCTRGYFRNPEATDALIDNGWLSSGDLAYLDEGELYLTGRVKDMIIRGGRNYYPYELEQAVSRVSGVRRNNVAVFASSDPDGGSERLVVVAETRVTDRAERERIRQAIVDASVDLMDSPPDAVSLQPPQAIPKTSSGKIRRPACRRLFEEGHLGRPQGLLRQMAHLLLGGIWPMIQRLLRATGQGLFAFWMWLFGLLIGIPAALLLLLMPGRRLRVALARGSSRLIFSAVRMGPRVQGLEHLPDGPCVLVVNHASYLDGAVLRAALPGPLYFVAKRELSKGMAGRLLKRIGAVWVARFDHKQALSDLEQAMAHLAKGERLLFFPEGTLSAAPGLRNFRIGAFMAAVRQQVPVVPVVLRGTRQALPGESWRPRPSRIEIRIGRPIEAKGEDWDAALDLRDRSRVWVLEQCGEADIAGEDGGLLGGREQGRL